MDSVKSLSARILRDDSENLYEGQHSPVYGQNLNQKFIKEFAIEFFEQNEVLLGAFYGNHYDGKKNRVIGLPQSYLLATNKRLICLARGLVCQSRDCFSYDEIASVGLSMDFCEGEIVYEAKGKERLFHSPYKDDLQSAWGLIREQLKAKGRL